MRPVQIILAFLVIAMLTLYFSRLRSGVLDRVVVLVFGALGIVMVAVPDLTTRAAQLVGVGRGADLFIYLALLGFAFICMLLYSKLRDMESTITHLARTVAIDRADGPGKQPENSGE
jgi:hypothetical protein